MAAFIVILTVLIMHFSSDKGESQERLNGHDGRKKIPSQNELKKLPEDGGQNYNRLVFEKSPYLLQHAANPVDWYPWGEAAFEKARREDKPIFLSIGYSTCHWCHVMEHESFEDTTVASLLNQTFVCIKVDREERPDIDQIYMSVCQAMTGSGGWPLTIIMTPDKRPFFAGTYFPKESRYQRIGMLELVPRLDEMWKNQRDKLLENSDKLVEHLRQNASVAAGEELTEAELNTAFQQLASRYDSEHGGFGSAPKFPSPHNLTFLLRYWHRSGEKQALEMVEKTLQQMRLGGIFDQVGFGFHRYSTDPVWLLPHFEKMLYDQAMLAMAYVETYQATGKKEYAKTAREIFEYVLRDMTAPEGGFYSAEDADSEGEEGLFYLWTPEELRELLGEEDGNFVMQLFNVEEGGNFADQTTRQKTGDSILHLKKSFANLAQGMGTTSDELEQRWQKARQKLFDIREARIHPLKDDKILTDWNGLMIAALAKGAAALDEPRYAEAAQKAAAFVLATLRNSDGTLRKRYRDGEAALPAHADDYAFMIWGLLELYETTFEVKHLQQALALNETLLNDFWDEENGGLFFTSDASDEALLVRSKEIYDGAIPSANSVAAMNLIRLARITANEDFEKKAVAVGKAFSSQVRRGPMGHTQLMSALSFWLGPAFEVVVAGESGKEDTQSMLRALSQTYIPNKVVVFRPEKDKPEIVALAGYTEFQRAIDGKATAYVCKNFACNAPTTDISEMLLLLNAAK